MGVTVSSSLKTEKDIRRSTTPSIAKNLGVTILLPEQMQQWDDLVSISPHGTVFHYSWWLEATGSKFKILGYWDEKGNLIGGIPLPFKKKAGLTLYHSPRLTPYLGPIFDLSSTDKNIGRISIMRECGEELARAIQGFDLLSYSAGAAAPDLQGFLWAGFRVDLTYTFRIEAGTTVEQAFQQVTRTHRQKLNKRAEFTIETGDDVSMLARLSRHTFERQGIACPYDEKYLQRLWQEASKRGRSILYTAHDLKGRAAAALLVVKDHRTTYQIVSGSDLAVSGQAAGSMLTWRAISDALNSGLTFDFEGSRIRGVEQYYRRWGGQAYPVWLLKKTGSLRGLLAKSFLSTVHGHDKPAKNHE